MSDSVERFPWQAQPGVEPFLRLPHAIWLAERAMIERGEDIANGKSPGHLAACKVLKARLDDAHILWEERKIEAHKRGDDFRDILALDADFQDWAEVLSNAATRWVDWPHYVASGMSDRTRHLMHNMQELEKRLHVISGRAAM